MQTAGGTGPSVQRRTRVQAIAHRALSVPQPSVMHRSGARKQSRSEPAARHHLPGSARVTGRAACAQRLEGQHCAVFPPRRRDATPKTGLCRIWKDPWMTVSQTTYRVQMPAPTEWRLPLLLWRLTLASLLGMCWRGYRSSAVRQSWPGSVSAVRCRLPGGSEIGSRRCWHRASGGECPDTRACGGAPALRRVQK